MIDPYSKITTIDMWSDPYISKQMLKHHLSFDNYIASRRYQTIKKTVEFIHSYIAPRQRLCDFGCGPGLYTNVLQQKGHRVYGVDISTTSLDYAKSHNKHVTYKQLNYITDTLNQPLDVAMMIWCDFGAMAPEARSQFLRNLHQTLVPGGLFFFDVFSEKRFQTLEESYTSKEEIDGFFMEGPVSIESRMVLYPELGLSLSYDKAVGQKIIELFNWDKHYTIEELEILLHDYNFELVDYFSDTTGQTDFTDNELYFVVAKRI
ncbi:class I SAM-dependent methyltransferase [Candidatus Xianfuyuplasma coldseepsis]|uniref:Class I SAM-dependent methyltransferase n=1 Tax=Candidatus Xianfuyuplasma coldseepsis TaxID=2782163 RepID=A0A7L7KRE4_9MOLU|nr:class I SAM-dependent methyltransferase [Xianfuyuplasma coldseepsis]QMS85155.1 class I SAM-dependent methyltransferase [Xianfuyuplasma coldseepsis]